MKKNITRSIRTIDDQYFDPDAPVGVPIRYIHEGCAKRGDKTLVVTRVETGWAFNCHRCGTQGFRDLTGFGGSTVAKFARATLAGVELVPEVLRLPERHPDPDPFVKNYFETWLMKYGITKEEEEKNEIFIDINSRLVIPVTKQGELIYWTSRGSKSNEPKWVNQRAAGRSDIYFIVASSDSFIEPGNVIIVEDIISAIKVGRIYPTIALLGSYIDDKLIYELTKRYQRIIIWLDFDKRGYVIRKLKRFREFGFPTVGIFTQKDPKGYDMKIIKHLGGIC